MAADMKTSSGEQHFILSPIFYRSFRVTHCRRQPLYAQSKKHSLPITLQETADAMSVLSINHKRIDTVIFDFDGTLAELNIDFNQMRRAINELVSGYGIDHQILRHKFVLEIIDEADALLQKSSNKKSESFAREACRIIEDIEVEAARAGRIVQRNKKSADRPSETFYSRSGLLPETAPKRFIRYFRTFNPIARWSSAAMMSIMSNRIPNSSISHCHRLGSRADNSIMIGDHPLDIETGRNAGTLTAGVLTGHFQENDFMNAGANMVLP